MLQQLGVIRHAAANPTAANQQLLQRMTDIASGEVNVDTLLNWDDLYKTIDSVYDGYYSRLCSRHGLQLNEKDIQLCCLLKANFSTKEISFVTQQSVRTVYQRKTQVRQKLGLEEKEDIAEATD
jgi:ribosome assembly protein YihI (activator of Der GTPase)